jgi:hypothetical protein
MLRLGCLVIVALLANPTTTRAEVPPLKFSDSDGPDRVEIEFQSRGCFHRDSASITIFRNPAYAHVDTGDKRTSLALSREDLASLDNLFDFYRSGPGNGCTTIETISITWYRGNAEITSEEFVDGSCRTNYQRSLIERLPPEERGVISAISLTLPQLIQRAER